MVSHMDNKEIENAYLVNEKGVLVGRMTGLFRFVSATPKRG